MAEDAGHQAVRLAVEAEMAHRGWNITQLRDATGIDAGTIGDFLNGQRWPRIKTIGRIEKAFDWPAGTVAQIRAGQAPPSVGGPDEDAQDNEEDQLLFRRPEGLSDEEWDLARRNAREIIEWQIEKVMRDR